MNNNCQYFENIFIDYINGSLQEKDNNFCRDHLKTCESCKNNDAFSELMFTWNKLDRVEEIQPSKNFIAKLQHEIVLIEEKRRIFWFKVDSFFSFAKVPVMTMLMIAFTFNSNMSYAGTDLNIDLNLRNKGEIIQESVKKVSDMKINELFEQMKQLNMNKKGEN